uniref:Uncharacterized protein n=1 Tax=Arundo donax TaxID=35708 RepID=A0A0A9B1D8_ARUDO
MKHMDHVKDRSGRRCAGYGQAVWSCAMTPTSLLLFVSLLKKSTKTRREVLLNSMEWAITFLLFMKTDCFLANSWQVFLLSNLDIRLDPIELIWWVGKIEWHVFYTFTVLLPAFPEEKGKPCTVTSSIYA